jgi:hypothetical protein
MGGPLVRHKGPNDACERRVSRFPVPGNGMYRRNVLAVAPLFARQLNVCTVKVRPVWYRLDHNTVLTQKVTSSSLSIPVGSLR